MRQMFWRGLAIRKISSGLSTVGYQPNVIFLKLTSHISQRDYINELLLEAIININIFISFNINEITL